MFYLCDLRQSSVTNGGERVGLRGNAGTHFTAKHQIYESVTRENDSTVPCYNMHTTVCTFTMQISTSQKQTHLRRSRRMQISSSCLSGRHMAKPLMTPRRATVCSTVEKAKYFRWTSSHSHYSFAMFAGLEVEPDSR